MRLSYNNLLPILQEMYSQKTRLYLTIFAIAWATFTITILLAIGQGLRQGFMHNLQQSGGNLVTLYAGQSSKSYHGKAEQNIHFDEQDLYHIRHGLHHLRDAIGIYNFHGPDDLKAGKHRPGPHTISAVPPLYQQYHNVKLQAGGRFINPLDETQQRHVCVLGHQVAENLFPHDPNPIGKAISLAGLPFRVIGVTQKRVRMSLGEAAVTIQIFIPSQTFKSLASDPPFNIILLRMLKGYDHKTLIANLKKIIADRRGLDATDPSILFAFDGHQFMKKSFRFMVGLQLFLGLIGSITLLVAAIGITNVIYISIHRATPMIGMRMALGAKPWMILRHYLAESMLVTSAGGILGLFLTLACIAAIRLIPHHHSSTTDVFGGITPILSWNVLLTIIALLGCIALLSGFFPAKKAAAIDPAEALRHD